MFIWRVNIFFLFNNVLPYSWLSRRVKLLEIATHTLILKLVGYEVQCGIYRCIWHGHAHWPGGGRMGIWGGAGEYRVRGGGGVMLWQVGGCGQNVMGY